MVWLCRSRLPVLKLSSQLHMYQCCCNAQGFWKVIRMKSLGWGSCKAISDFTRRGGDTWAGLLALTMWCLSPHLGCMKKALIDTEHVLVSYSALGFPSLHNHDANHLLFFIITRIHIFCYMKIMRSNQHLPPQSPRSFPDLPQSRIIYLMGTLSLFLFCWL